MEDILYEWSELMMQQNSLSAIVDKLHTEKDLQESLERARKMNTFKKEPAAYVSDCTGA